MKKQGRHFSLIWESNYWFIQINTPQIKSPHFKSNQISLMGFYHKWTSIEARETHPEAEYNNYQVTDLGKFFQACRFRA